MKRNVKYGLGIAGCGLAAAVCDVALYGTVTPLSGLMVVLGVAILVGLL